jgi:hypothetical protein
MLDAVSVAVLVRPAQETGPVAVMPVAVMGAATITPRAAVTAPVATRPPVDTVPLLVIEVDCSEATVATPVHHMSLMCHCIPQHRNIPTDCMDGTVNAALDEMPCSQVRPVKKTG